VAAVAAEPSEQRLDALLQEDRVFRPSAAFAAAANAADASIYERADRDPLAFWAEQARALRWMTPYQTVMEGDVPHVRWFGGGRLNVADNCVDRHCEGPRRNKAAIIWVAESGETRTLTYQHLQREVSRCANVLRSLGVGRGDRVAIYMGMVPETAVAMLACTRIGAPHTVVFGGFSADALRERMCDAECKLLITQDGAYRRGNVVPLLQNAAEALRGAPQVQKVLVLRRVGAPALAAQLPAGMAVDWHEAMAAASARCPCEPMESEDMLYILYTSGTTGKPKGIVHATAGYLLGVATTHRLIFDLKEEDVYWCAADIGWVTGHSYIVYGPLCNGATTVMYEGTPDYPARDRHWRIVEELGVNTYYTAPTTIRTFMRWGTEHPGGADLSSLRVLGSVGEPINPEAWMWYHQNIGRGRCPIVDTWWQTETGMIMITPLPGLVATKPGSATRPFPGVAAEVLDERGEPVGPGAGGNLVLTRPWPAMMRTIFGDDERFVRQYWSRYPGKYLTGDGARVDADGYFWLLGRVDDVMNVSGHRLSTYEIESALVDHAGVAEAAVIGRYDALKGQAVAAFVTLKESADRAAGPAAAALRDELKAHVARKIGPIARPDDVFFTAELPKTRSGKIMRRLLRDIAEGRALGDTTTLADPGVVQRLKAQYEEAGD
jgi:acetyl-CoA synthetase